MPSLQHTLLRFSADQTRFMVSMKLPNVKTLRRVLSLSPLGLPGRVTTESFQIGALPAEWLRPEGADLSRVLLFLHGGGYVVGSIETHRGLAAHLAQKIGIQALIIDYRLAPEHPFPAALEDAISA
jgi:epsilon-lactone hydrolase